MFTPWHEARQRYALPDPFYAVIDPLGHWVDSARFFATAVHWAACDLGHMNEDPETELGLLNDAGYSIVHSSLLPALYEAGVIS